MGAAVRPCGRRCCPAAVAGRGGRWSAVGRRRGGGSPLLHQTTAMQAMPSARPSAPMPSARVALTETGAPSTPPSRSTMAAVCGARRGVSAMTVQSALRARKALLGGQADHLGEQRRRCRRPPTRDRCRGSGGRGRPGRRRRGRRRPARGTPRRRRCGRRGRVRPRSRRRRARAGGAGLRRSGGCRCPGRCARSPASRPQREPLGRAEVVGVVILMLPGSPGTTRTRAPERLDEHGVVGGLGAALRRGPGAACAARNACGVCTATRCGRSRVLVTSPTGPRLDGVTRREPGNRPDHAFRLQGPSTAANRPGGRQRARRVVHHDDVRARRAPLRGRSAPSRRGSPRPRRPRRRRDASLVRGPPARPGRRRRRRPARVDGPRETGRPPREANCLRLAESTPRSTGDDDRPHLRHGATGPGDQVRASFRRSSAVSSSTLRANVSSETRIWRARCSIRFSPAERPLSLSRMDRFRTTSATW